MEQRAAGRIVRAVQLKIFPILRFPLGQPLDRSLQSTLPRFVALRIRDPRHVFFSVAVTEIFERLSRLCILLQRRFQIGRDAQLLLRARSRTRFLNAGLV